MATTDYIASGRAKHNGALTVDVTAQWENNTLVRLTIDTASLGGRPISADDLRDALAAAETTLRAKRRPAMVQSLPHRNGDR